MLDNEDEREPGAHLVLEVVDLASMVALKGCMRVHIQQNTLEEMQNFNHCTNKRLQGTKKLYITTYKRLQGVKKLYITTCLTNESKEQHTEESAPHFVVVQCCDIGFE